tara:strand:- start:192 stop:389 length:198 start_codon:yes stop_codon:yes gene_type:complete
MDIKLLGFPIFTYIVINENEISGFKIKLMKLLSFTATLGEAKGDHLMFAFGIYKLDVIIGTSLWR